ncbi:MAG: hypothetical protein NTX97_13595 [Bacteroidetes bacterium]|nr:hypothetical protein [Bacteroidota bacterium]
MGYEKTFSFGSIYGEARLTVPLNNVNNQNQNGFPYIPGAVAFQLGYKYLFGK